MKKLAAVYAAERFVYTKNFSEPQNPRFIIKSGFKSRAGYNGARTVVDYFWQLFSFIWEYLLNTLKNKISLWLNSGQSCTLVIMPSLKFKSWTDFDKGISKSLVIENISILVEFPKLSDNEDWKIGVTWH